MLPILLTLILAYGSDAVWPAEASTFQVVPCTMHQSALFSRPGKLHRLMLCARHHLSILASASSAL